MNEIAASRKTAEGEWVDSTMMDSSECISPNAIFFSRADMNPKVAKLTPMETLYSKDTNSEKSSRTTSTSVATPISVRVKPSARFSGREFNTRSIEKERDSHLKCRKKVWLSCIGVKGCMPTNGVRILKKDRSSDIESMTSKEREIRVSWAEKHRPGSLAGFVCHKKQALLLKQLVRP